MKAQDENKDGQGKPASDGAFFDHKAEKQRKGISNNGGQQSDQTPNRDNERKIANKRRSIL